MPATVQVVNRYVNGDNVTGAAVVFDGAAIDAHSPRTGANGQVVVATEALADGDHVMHIVPNQTSAAPVGPAVAEGLAATVARMFRSLDVNVTISKGKITATSAPLAQALNGAALGTNPVRVQLQPIYYRSQYQNANDRAATDITLIVVHQTAGAANIGGTLETFTIPNLGANGTSAHYVVSAETVPQVVKVVQDTNRSWQAGHNTSWKGASGVNHFSLGIELSHKTGTPFPDKQIDALLDLLDRLRAAYPTIPANGVVGHMDVLLENSDPWLSGRDCPGFDFEWPLLEARGLGLIPRGGAANLDMYGGFFRVATAAHNALIAGDSDASRTWGGVKWPAPAPPPAAAAPPPAPGAPPAQPAPPTVTGAPIAELQTDLRDIGYLVEVNGHYNVQTLRAVQMFQQHFFAGTRRSLIQENDRKKVNQVTAEFIKQVR
jgi:N-acetyl-anhydromuramyl-L-alanine amidase AmpD